MRRPPKTQGEGSADPVKCFLVGCPRSGTTLLSVMLDRHDGLAITPETAFYDEIAPEALADRPEEMLARLAAWRRLGELGLRWDDLEAAGWPPASAAGLLRAVLSLYARRRGRPFVGEKTPQHWRHARRLLVDFPEARLIWLIRDGRDVVQSLSEMPWWRHGPLAAAELWARSTSMALEIAAEAPRRVLLVRHESVLDAPERTLDEVMGALGLQAQARQLDGATPSPVVLQRSMPWKGRALGAIDPARRGRWRDQAPEDWPAVLRVLEPELARLGYG